MVSSVGKRMFSVLVSILIGYVLVLALCRIFESRLIFFPNYPDRLGGDWNPRGLGVQDVWLAADDGTSEAKGSRASGASIVMPTQLTNI